MRRLTRSPWGSPTQAWRSKHPARRPPGPAPRLTAAPPPRPSPPCPAPPAPPATTNTIKRDNLIIALPFTAPPVPITARVHSTPQ
eukprot:2106381-Pyramimonas_sp.AAC.1